MYTHISMRKICVLFFLEEYDEDDEGGLRGLTRVFRAYGYLRCFSFWRVLIIFCLLGAGQELGGGGGYLKFRLEFF